MPDNHPQDHTNDTGNLSSRTVIETELALPDDLQHKVEDALLSINGEISEFRSHNLSIVIGLSEFIDEDMDISADEGLSYPDISELEQSEYDTWLG